jgi:hypothetical protein
MRLCFPSLVRRVFHYHSLAYASGWDKWTCPGLRFGLGGWAVLGVVDGQECPSYVWLLTGG